jgi:hypothetical protein
MLRVMRCAGRVILAAALLLRSAPAAAADPSEPSEPPEPPAQARAEARFLRGRAAFREGQWAAALADFLVSRQLYPTWSATSNAAVCLEKLQRYDEALDLFESLLRDFGDRMPAPSKEQAQREVVDLRSRVGILEITGAEIGAALAVDGRTRGEYPPVHPLRVPAGTHTVRLFKEGFEPFEIRVDVAGGQVAGIVARLQPLVASGRLRVTEARGARLEVLVDGSLAGTTPWEGRLPVGDHMVVLRGAGALGTPPLSVAVERDRTTPLTLAAEVLDATMRVVPTPANASVAVDRVTVGRGTWEGRLRAGAHVVESAADGFTPAVRRLDLAPDAREVVLVTLERDPRSPFWKKPERRPRFLVEASVSVALVPTFGGDVAGACTGACRLGLGLGGAAVLHLGYELGTGLGFGVTAGYLAASQPVDDRIAAVRPVGLPPDQGLAADRLTLRGALLGAWIGYTRGERLTLRLRAGAGALLGVMRDGREGRFTADHGSAFQLGPVVDARRAGFFHVTPEARVGLRLGGHVEVSAGVAALVLVGVQRPRWDPTHDVRAGSDGFGSFGPDALAGRVVVVVTPGLGTRYDF